MKKIVSLTIVALFSLLLAACSDRGPVVKTGPATESAPPKVYTSPAASLAPVTRTVKAIVISKLNTEFTSKPNCDGGECYDIDFTVAFKFDGYKTVAENFSFQSFSYEPGTAKSDPRVVSGKKLYDTLSKIDPEKLSLTLTDDKVTKITRVQEEQGTTLIPEEVLWEKKSY
jgi:hypothetical protein